MYLVGSAIEKTSTLTEWKGRKGRFVRTFGMNTKRNMNLWKVTWDSIKKYIHTALKHPGIEYEKCTSDGCDLDHVEADSFSSVMEKQKPYHRTEIVDYVLDEITESVDLIHEVFDDEFWEKLQNHEIKYVSPMIWPYTKGFEIIGYDIMGNRIIDAFAWKFVHDAFLRNSPAYGNDVAQVKSMCDGENCQVQLLAAKKQESAICGNCTFFVENHTCKLVKGEIKYEDICDLHTFGKTNPPDTKTNPKYEKLEVNYKHALVPPLQADTSTANSENISHLQEIPLLYKHKGKLHYISASDKVQEIIKKKKEAGITIDDQALAIAYSEAGESNNTKSSFKTCTCDTKQNHMPTDEEYNNLKSKLKATEDEKKELEGKLKANDEDKDKVAHYAKLKSKFTALFKGNTDEERKDVIAKMKGMEDEEHMKAMDEVHKEMKAKEDGEGNDTEISKLTAKIEKMEKQNLPMYIDGLIALKASSGVPQKAVREYHTALLAKTFEQVETLYVNDEIIIKALPAKVKEETSTIFHDDENSSLKGKTSEDIILEAQS